MCSSGRHGVAHSRVALHIECFDHYFVLAQSVERDDLHVDATGAQALRFVCDVALSFPAVGGQHDASPPLVAEEATREAQAGREVGTALGAESLGAAGRPLAAGHVFGGQQNRLLANGDKAHGLAGCSVVQHGLGILYLGGSAGGAKAVGGIEGDHEIIARVDAGQDRLGEGDHE